jgi:peptidoglycan hydrolase CwlO-like protein
MALTRAEMEAVIAGGGSVSIGGQHYTTLDSLPAEAVLASGDPERLEAARADVEQRIDALQQELAELKAALKDADQEAADRQKAADAAKRKAADDQKAADQAAADKAAADQKAADDAAKQQGPPK